MKKARPPGPYLYGWLLCLLVVDYFILILNHGQAWATIAESIAIALTAIMGIFITNPTRLLIRIALLTALFLIAITIASVIAGETSSAFSGHQFLLGLIMGGIAIAALRDVLHQPQVTAMTITGAICIYLLIGITFALVFVAGNNLSGSFVNPSNRDTTADFVYLSFVTLTTTGFGDITPATSFAQAVVVLEAVVGQVFLVTLVARLVAMVGQRRSS